jgi:hypothetical protein
MGWKEEENDNRGDDRKENQSIGLPPDGVLTFDGFRNIYEAELRQGKLWGIAYDLALLGEPLVDAGVFQGRYDRMYCSSSVQPAVVMDFVCSNPCPNKREPSDHLPLAASFHIKELV